MPEPKDPREPRIPTDSPTFDADNRWTRTWIMYFESLFKLSVKEAVRLAGTVTHIGGALTKDLPVFGNDAGDIKVGTKSGNTNKLITNTGTNVTGNTVKWDANGNLIDAGTAPGGGSGTVTAVTGTAPIASSGGTTPAISIAAFTGDSGSGGAKGAVPAPAAGDAAALKVLGAGGGWVAGGAGTVTHTGGALTADQPVFGAGSADVKVGTKTGTTNTVVTSTGSRSTGNTVKWDASGNLIDAGATPGTGTVTSVALTVPAEFSVSGSPVTTSGTLAVSKATQSANAVFAGPTTGSAAAPTFRAVVPADLPLASSSAFGAVKVDGTTITAASGVISAAGGGSAGALVLLESHTASSSATLDFTTRNAPGQSGATFQSDFDTYIVRLVNVLPASASNNLLLRVSTGGGTYDAGSNYEYAAYFTYPSSSGVTASSADTSYLVAGTNVANGTLGVNGEVEFIDPLNAALHKAIQHNTVYYHDSLAKILRIIGSGRYKSNTAIVAFRFLMSSGNITSGIIRVYGMAK